MQVVSDFVQHSNPIVFAIVVGVFAIAIITCGILLFLLYANVVERLAQDKEGIDGKSLLNYRVKFGGLNDGTETFYSLVTKTRINTEKRKLFPYEWDDNGGLYKIDGVDTQEVPKVKDPSSKSRPVQKAVNKKREVPNRNSERVVKRAKSPVEKKKKQKSKGLRRVSR